MIPDTTSTDVVENNFWQAYEVRRLIRSWVISAKIPIGSRSWSIVRKPSVQFEAYVQGQPGKSFAKLQKPTVVSSDGSEKKSSHRRPRPQRHQTKKQEGAGRQGDGAQTSSSSSKCTGKCFNCGKIGHYAAVCRSQKFCMYNVLEHPCCGSTLHNVCVCACKQHDHFMDKDDHDIALTIVSQLGPQKA